MTMNYMKMDNTAMSRNNPSLTFALKKQSGGIVN